MSRPQRIEVTAPKPPAGALPRHERMDDLLGISDDPAPRKCRRIEWIGEQSPLENPVVQYNLAMGLYTETQAKAIRWMAATAHTRIMRSRLAEHDHQLAQAAFKHLNRTYHFTKENNWTCDVDYSDVDVLLGSDVGHEFRDITEMTPDQLAEPIFKAPPVKVIVLSRQAYESTDEALGVGASVAQTGAGRDGLSRIDPNAPRLSGGPSV